MFLRYIIFLFGLVHQHIFKENNEDFKKLSVQLSKIKAKNRDFKIISEYRKQLAQNNNIISQSDAGAGSRIRLRKPRAVSQIARQSSSTAKNGKLLFRIIQCFNSESIIELGTSLGIGSLYMLMANKKADLITIEFKKELHNLAKEKFSELGLSNVRFTNGLFDDKLEWAIKNKKYVNTLVFIDGNHQLQSTIKYFSICSNLLEENSVLVFDDIYWSKEMAQAWKKICKSENVKLCIDLFFMGLVVLGKRKSHKISFKKHR